MVTRGFPNIVTFDPVATKAWYLELFELAIEFDSEWFVHLKAPAAPGVELGIIDANHEIVSEVVTPGSGGVMLTFVVDDVDATYRKATHLGRDIVEEPRDLFYGQRRMVLRDPNSTLVDVSSECEPSQEFLDTLPQRSDH